VSYVKIVGRCEACAKDVEVEIKTYPYVAEPGGRVMVEVVAHCKTCDAQLDTTWAHLGDLRPDWTAYEEAKARLGL